MTVRSWRLAGPIALAAGVNPLLEPDVGRTVIIKNLAVINNSGANRTVGLYLNGVVSGARVWRRELLPAESLLLTDLFIVVPGGEVLNAEATALGPVLSLFGAYLLGQPE